MKFELHEERTACPYCGERLSLLVEPSEMDLTYIEDCHVCCRPINVNVIALGCGEISITTTSENDA